MQDNGNRQRPAAGPQGKFIIISSYVVYLYMFPLLAERGQNVDNSTSGCASVIHEAKSKKY